MNGQIAVLKNGWGFICADDTQSVYFSKRSLSAGVEFSLLEKGDRVTFEAVETDKGLSAKVVRIAPRRPTHTLAGFHYRQAARFVQHALGDPEPWEDDETTIEGSVVELRTRFYDTAGEAFDDLAGRAQLAGANFVVDFRYEQREITVNGQLKPVFSCVADAGLVVRIMSAASGEGFSYQHAVDLGQSVKRNLEAARYIPAVRAKDKLFLGLFDLKLRVPITLGVAACIALRLIFWG